MALQDLSVGGKIVVVVLFLAVPFYVGAKLFIYWFPQSSGATVGVIGGISGIAGLLFGLYLKERIKETIKRGRTAKVRAQSLESLGYAPYSARPSAAGRVVDFRSEEEKEVERRTKRELPNSDEAIARRLVSLLGQTKDVKVESIYTEIRQIGEDLNKRGGKSDMVLLLYRVRALGGQARLLEMYWDGIGEWQGCSLSRTLSYPGSNATMPHRTFCMTPQNHSERQLSEGASHKRQVVFAVKYQAGPH